MKRVLNKCYLSPADSITSPSISVFLPINSPSRDDPAMRVCRACIYRYLTCSTSLARSAINSAAISYFAFSCQQIRPEIYQAQMALSCQISTSLDSAQTSFESFLDTVYLSSRMVSSLALMISCCLRSLWWRVSTWVVRAVMVSLWLRSVASISRTVDSEQSCASSSFDRESEARDLELQGSSTRMDLFILLIGVCINLMKKWELQNRLKSHKLKVSQAKSTVAPLMKKRPSTSTLPARDTARRDCQSYPLFKVLKALGMQQYARTLVDRGFGDDLVRFQLLRKAELESLFQELKLAPGHKTKFLMLIDYIRSINQSNLQAQLQTEVPSSRNSSKNLTQRPKPSSAHIKTRPSPKVSNTTFNKHFAISPRIQTSLTKESSWQKKIPVPPIIGQNKVRASDDLYIYERVIKGRTFMANSQTRILTRLAAIRPQNSELLGFRQIRGMFQSLQGGIMTSTIINIDLEQLCRQYAAVIHSRVRPTPLLDQQQIPTSVQVKEVKPLKKKAKKNQWDQEQAEEDEPKSAPASSIESSLGYNQLPYKQPQQPEQKQGSISYESSQPSRDSALSDGLRQRQRQNQVLKQFLDRQQITSIIRQSCLISAKAKHQYCSVLPEEQVESQEQQSCLTQSIIPDPSLPRAQLRKQFFRAFRSSDSAYQVMPDIETIYGFIKNVVSSSKMEKQTPVLSLAYINRICESCSGYPTNDNWRNLVFITLVVASKVWDDQSFQNDSFAKAFSDFTTLQINRLQRLLSQFLDYNFSVSPEEYSKTYFSLRQLKEDKQKCFSLKSLGLQTVLKLQKTGNRLNVCKEAMLKGLDKSF